MVDELQRDLENKRPVRVPPLAKQLNRSVNAIYLAIKRGEIASSRIGKSIRIPHEEAARLLGLETSAAQRRAA